MTDAIERVDPFSILCIACAEAVQAQCLAVRDTAVDPQDVNQRRR